MTDAEQEEHKEKERKEFARQYYDYMQGQNKDSAQLSKYLHRPRPEDLNDQRKAVPLQLSQSLRLSDCTEEEVDQHLQARFADPTV